MIYQYDGTNNIRIIFASVQALVSVHRLPVSIHYGGLYIAIQNHTSKHAHSPNKFTETSLHYSISKYRLDIYFRLYNIDLSIATFNILLMIQVISISYSLFLNIHQFKYYTDIILNFEVDQLHQCCKLSSMLPRITPATILLLPYSVACVCGWACLRVISRVRASLGSESMDKTPAPNTPTEDPTPLLKYPGFSNYTTVVQM